MEKIGKYNISGELGRGAMGIVYRGEDPVIGRPVAIKTIRFDTLTQASEQEKAQRRFMREARSAGNLSHPNIATIYDVGEDEGLTYIVMEFIEGQSLEELIKGGQRFAVDEIIAIMAQIGDALDFAHSKGIVHRDIKPGNILLDRAGRPHIVDFGIARISSSTMTHTSMIMGTPFYMSPEQVAGKKVNNRADIFSLGAVLYEMLTLEKAFPGDSITAVIYKIVNEHPVPVRNFQQDLPDGLDHILHTALAKDPSQRYSTCAELAQDLQNYPAYAGIVPDDPPTITAPIPVYEKARKTIHRTDVPSVANQVFVGQKERNRKPLLYVLGAMMIVVIFSVVAVVIFSNKDKTPVVLGGAAPPVQLKILPTEKPDPKISLSEQIRSYEERAETFFKEGNNEGAIVLLEKILELNPKHSKAELNLGLVLVDQGRLDEAKKRFENYLVENTEDPAPYFYLGLLSEEMNDPERALAYLKTYRSIASEGPDISEVEKTISKLEKEAQAKQGQEQTADIPPEKKRQTVLDITEPRKKPEAKPITKQKEEDPEPKKPEEKTTEVSSLLDQGIRAFDAKKYDQTILQMRAVLEIEPQNSIANYYINKAKSVKAERQKQQSIKNLLRGAKSDLDKNDFNRCIQRARKVLQLDPKNAEASDIMVRANAAEQKYSVRSIFDAYSRGFGSEKLDAFFKKYCVPTVYNKEKPKARMLTSFYRNFSNQFSDPEIIMTIDGNSPDSAIVQFQQVSKAISRTQGLEGEIVNGSYKWELKQVGKNWMIIKITYWGR